MCLSSHPEPSLPHHAGHAYLGDFIAQIAKLYYTKRFQLRYILSVLSDQNRILSFSLRNSMP